MSKLHNRPSRIDYRRDLRQHSTTPERLLWACLRGNQLGIKFRRQHSIGNFIVDFYAAEVGLIVEIDGDSHYASVDAQEYDRTRDQYLSGLGFQIQRFTNHDVMANREGVLQHILAVIALQPPPQPSP